MRTSTRILLVLGLAAAAGLGGCGSGSTAEECPRGQDGDWSRVRANTPDFEISLCVPPGYRTAGALTWAQPSVGGIIRVENGFVHMGARAVLSECAELETRCAEPDSTALEGLKKELRLRDRRATVLETGLLTGGLAGGHPTRAALLRVELGPDQFAVVRALERDPDRGSIKRLRRVLDSVRFERVGGAGAP